MMPSQSTDADKNTHIIKPDEPVQTNIVNNTAWTWEMVEVDVGHKTALARRSEDPDTGRITYWLKRATAGPEKGFLYNPTSACFHKSYESTYFFTRVSMEAFDAYCAFLRTRNPMHCRQAERL